MVFKSNRKSSKVCCNISSRSPGLIVFALTKYAIRNIKMNTIPRSWDQSGPKTDFLKRETQAEADPTSENWSFYYTSEDVLSIPKKKKPHANAVVQTKPVWTAQRGTQMMVAFTETQTVEPTTPDDMQEYPESLVEFIQKVTPVLCAELENNSTVDQIGIFEDLLTSLQEIVVENPVSRKRFSFKNKSATCREMTSATMTWTNHGRHMAVCYSCPEGEHGRHWCHHTSALALYNLKKLELDTASDLQYPRAERELVDIDYCFSVLEFSPLDASLLAAGKADGEIVLMDFASTEGISQPSVPKRIKYIRDHICHSDKIVSLQWIVLNSIQIQEQTWQNPQPANQFLISASKDGFIGFWSLGKVSFSLHLEKRFTLLAENIADSPLFKNEADFENIQELGITSLSCSESDPTKIIFSTYGSLVVSGDIFSIRQLSAGDPKVPGVEYDRASQIPLYDPDSAVIISEADLIVAVHSSPFHQSYVLILTIGGHLTLQNILDRHEPTLEFFFGTMETSTDVKWSPHRPMMFAVTYGQNLFFYDLLNDRTEPSLTLKHGCQLTSIKFNKSCVGEIAVSDVKGEISVWDLSPGISLRQPRELAQLTDLQRQLH